MGPTESPTGFPQNQATSLSTWRRRPPRQSRMRRCLLKGCQCRYRPRQALQRYCSPECRQAARAWSHWKAQERYRATAAGPMPALPRTSPNQEETGLGDSPRGEGNHYQVFLRSPAIGRAATKDSCVTDDRRCNDSARRSAGMLCSACGSGRDAGNRPGCDPDSHVTCRSPGEAAAPASGIPPPRDKREILTALPAFD